MVKYLFFSGSPHDSMVVLKQESRYAMANDHSFSRVYYLAPFAIQFFLARLECVTQPSLYCLDEGMIHLNHVLSANKKFPDFQFSMQIEQGIPVLSKWLIFNRFKFAATRGIKLGPAFFLARYPSVYSNFGGFVNFHGCHEKLLRVSKQAENGKM